MHNCMLTTDDEALETKLSLEKTVESGAVLARITVIDSLILR